MFKITESKLIKSATCLKELPDTKLPEFVLIGRSNVGKSSFINSICNRKNLAYISKTPGKTRLINLYQINEDFIFADLPGYGYAKTSMQEQKQWQKKLEEYLIKRKQIVLGIHLIDSRHEIQKNDFQMHEWLVYYKLPMLKVLTKSDYLSRHKINMAIEAVKKEFDCDVLPYSSKTKDGKDEILSYIKKRFN